MSPNKPFSPQESDRIDRIASVYRDVVRFFGGDENAAREWLTSLPCALAFLAADLSCLLRKPKGDPDETESLQPVQDFY